MAVYGDLSPSFCTVSRWIQHFTDGRESVEGEARAGRPRTFVTDSSVERAEAVIVKDTTIHSDSIVHEQLGRFKRCRARWIPHPFDGTFTIIT